MRPQPMTAFPAQYADAATILLDAIAEVAQEQPDGSLVINPLELPEAVTSQKLLAGLSGTISFDENRGRLDPTAGLQMCRVENGRFVSFSF